MSCFFFRKSFHQQRHHHHCGVVGVVILVIVVVVLNVVVIVCVDVVVVVVGVGGCLLVSSFVFWKIVFGDEPVLSCRGVRGRNGVLQETRENVVAVGEMRVRVIAHKLPYKPCRDGRFGGEGCHRSEVWWLPVVGAGDSRCRGLSICRGLFYLTKKVSWKFVVLMLVLPVSVVMP